ncbi:hypothetical protein QYF36_014457 [Acer negundo]|nr:hypothetical protein QYF36_014457 [Acer negundo]
MVKLHPGISRLAYFCINLFCCISILETCMMWVALLVPNVLMGIGVGTCVVMLMMMASEMFKPDLPKFFWRYPMSYMSFASGAIQGQYKNDMIGIEFDPQNPGDKKVKGRGSSAENIWDGTGTFEMVGFACSLGLTCISQTNLVCSIEIQGEIIITVTQTPCQPLSDSLLSN